MKVQKIFINSYEESRLVLDNEYKPIKPITEFIKYLRKEALTNRRLQLKAMLIV